MWLLRSIVLCRKGAILGMPNAEGDLQISLSLPFRLLHPPMDDGANADLAVSATQITSSSWRMHTAGANADLPVSAIQIPSSFMLLVQMQISLSVPFRLLHAGANADLTVSAIQITSSCHAAGANAAQKQDIDIPGPRALAGALLTPV